ncbi:MAG: aminotransferase class III-fold pyridoxal phosphate-dependent enzyme, partial [Bernardetiaceae bacterium]|nr:aminotransferase class III-fold pyridoxal phosphate-dependent enzyme [Bernardetiaceae bacterium]
PVRAVGSHLWDKHGQQYLDLYGGHAVISIGHTHPHYVRRITEQLQKIGFYSNSILNPLQDELAEKLGQLSGHPDFSLFLINSGAEANENALKLASFHTGRTKVLAFKRGFHGRTAGAVAVTDNPAIAAPINSRAHVQFLPYNDQAALEAAFDDTVAAVIIEGIQGLGGIYVGTDDFWQTARRLCDQHGAVLISDSVQCGYARSGRFFSHHFSGVEPDLITTAKGMGNGFPVASVLIHPKFKAKPGLLGTTFGGSHLACAAALAVLEVIEQEQLITHAEQLGRHLMGQLRGIEGVREVRGRGLMIGIELELEAKLVRDALLFQHHIFTGSSSDKHTLRLLPALNLGWAEAEQFLDRFQLVMSQVTAKV